MRIVTGLFFLGAALCAPGCSDGDGEGGTTDPTPESTALLEACTLDLLDVFEELPDLLLVAQGETGGAVVAPSRDPADPRPAFTVHVPIDLDGDGNRDDAVDGTITFSRDPALGFAPGDTASLSWTLVGDDAQGSGTFDLRVTPSGMVEVTGSGTITTGGCTMDLVIDEAHAVAVPLRTAPQAPSDVALPFEGGRIRFVLEAGPETLGGTITRGAATLEVYGADVNGVPVPDFPLGIG